MGINFSLTNTYKQIRYPPWKYSDNHLLFESTLSIFDILLNCSYTLKSCLFFSPK